jgi:hypothetical protein
MIVVVVLIPSDVCKVTVLNRELVGVWEKFDRHNRAVNGRWRGLECEKSLEVAVCMAWWIEMQE